MSGPNPEQIAAWAAYQQARSDLGLLTEVEHAAAIGGQPLPSWADMDARR